MKKEVPLSGAALRTGGALSNNGMGLEMDRFRI
jgi:hypothetical protein